MSLCGELRSDAVTLRQNDLTACAKSQGDGLRALLAVHATVTNNSSLSSLLNTALDPDNLTDLELSFLKNNGLLSGRTFDAAALVIPPTPSTTHNDAPIYSSKPNSNQYLSVAHSRSSENGSPSPAATTLGQAQPATSSSQATINTGNQDLDFDSAVDPSGQRSSVSPIAAAASDPDGPSAPPALLAPPQPDEEAEFSGATQQLLDRESPQRPAKVVHLPPENVQEERLREREAEGHRRELSVDSNRLQRPPMPAEVASSPSSTVGAHSTATPVAPQTPDTSPDSETTPTEVLPPKDLQPSPERQREREEHDRLLAAQKEIARAQALGDVATPDEQLKLEEREAAARDSEEKAAHEDGKGPEPDAHDAVEVTEAEEVAESMEADRVEAAQQSRPDGGDDAEDAPRLSRKSAATSQDKTDDEGDNIVVVPRMKAQPVPDASIALSPRSTHPSEALDKTTNRPASGTLSQAVEAGPRPSSADTMSVGPSLSAFQPSSLGNADSSLSSSLTPTRRLKERIARTSQSELYPAVEHLSALKGAADDPDKDYLEPLFRIQAHEPPNSRTRTLSELVKMVPKALSTQDHFISSHERLDFRMLRRIYQLQNANKWSLRQMEKCSEPEQPITHHDHLMAEMKWLRRDFQSERKMKKSVCAWLAQRCAEWVKASRERRLQLQMKVKIQQQPEDEVEGEDPVPDLEQADESAPEDEASPLTPSEAATFTSTLIVPPELSGAVQELQTAGTLVKALDALPTAGILNRDLKHEKRRLTSVSKFVEGKILPPAVVQTRKRSRFEYEDEADVTESQPDKKRLRYAEEFPPDDPECALFHPDNKPVRDRLHSNNAFRPPSEFVMPSITFYEYRNGSQWIWEDDQKLRRLAKDYSFNWSLIADEMALPTRFKGSAERRTPWECFERWVEVESLPADMRKTLYFKTWFQRLESSQQAADRRYQIQIAAIQQQQAQNGAQPHNIPMRKKTTPTRVEKRKATRYLWMVDAFRKLAKKREQHAWKQAEAARAAAQRKSQTENNLPNQVKMTPQEFSRKRHMADLQYAEAQKQLRQKHFENQQRQLQMARAAQQQNMQNGMTAQQRAQANGAPNQGQGQPNGQQNPNVSGQLQQQQGRPGMPVATRNGHLAVPQVNGQSMPQAQMQQRAAMAHAGMQQMAQANMQARNVQFPNQQFQMPNGNMQSPGSGGLSNQQQLQANQFMLAAYAAQQQQQQQQQQASNGTQTPSITQGNSQMSSSPSMPPPPTPQNGPQQLSSGHVPQIIAIKNQLRANNPGISEENLIQLATQQMKNQSQSSTQARQNAMNAAAGISQGAHANMQGFAHNQAAFQSNNQMSANGMSNGMYTGGNNGEAPNQQQHGNMSSHPFVTSSPQQAYANLMRQRSLAQMNRIQGSPANNAAMVNGNSPSLAHASPNMAPASPAVQYANMNAMAGGQQQRPPSRSNTPQMQRLGSSGSVVQSPGAGMQQGSPMARQASMAR